MTSSPEPGQSGRQERGNERGNTRVAILAHNHPSLNKGGAEISAYNLFEGLKALGADPIFIAACASGRRGQLYLDGPDEFALFYDESDYSHYYQIGSPAVEAELAQMLDDNGVCVLNFHHFVSFGLNTLEAMARSGRRTFLTLHEYSAICQHYGQMVTRPDKQLCTRASPSRCNKCFPEYTPHQFEQRRRWFHGNLLGLDGLIAPSHFLKRRFTEWGLPPERIAVVENALARDAQDAPEPGPRDPDAAWTFGYFGQITPFKGVDVLLAAAEALGSRGQGKRIRIRVHGNLVNQPDEFLERFRAACAGPGFEYVGAYDNEDVEGLMRDCDYVVLPSLWWENSPVVIQEAYAARRPVIASGLGGLAEKVVDGKTGLHFRVGSPDSLLSAMQAAASPEAWATFRANLPVPRNAVETARIHLDLYASTSRPDGP